MTRRWQALLAGGVAIIFAAAGFLAHQWQAADAPPDPVATGRMVLAAELMGLENVVLTPHLGSSTIETRTAMGQLALDNLAAWFAGKSLLTEVNETQTARRVAK